MWRKLIQSCLDPIIVRLSRRIDWLRNESIYNSHHCAIIHPTATVYSFANINNMSGDANTIEIGAYTHLRGKLMTFSDGGRITIGEWCHIGEESRIWSQTSVSIGNYVLISYAVNIHDTNGHSIDWRERRMDIRASWSNHNYLRSTNTVSSAVTIEDDVWIGFGATILKGVRVGRGAIVAAKAVVINDVPPGTVVAGNPAKLVRFIETSDDRQTEA